MSRDLTGGGQTTKGLVVWNSFHSSFGLPWQLSSVLIPDTPFHQVTPPREHLTPASRSPSSHYYSQAILHPAFAAESTSTHHNLSPLYSRSLTPRSYSRFPQPKLHLNTSSSRLLQHQHVFLRSNPPVYIGDQFKISTKSRPTDAPSDRDIEATINL